ncbi:MAG: H-X9-DG-CTERM domain-containing protein [Tepidisphaeraceae bacterium]
MGRMLMPRPMNPATPQSDPDAPQPLEYARPGNWRSRRPHWFLWCLLAVLVFLLLSILLPTGYVSPHRANQIKSASNLLQIGQAISLYTIAHKGEYPDSFRTIFLNEDVVSEVFVSPERFETPASGPWPAITDQVIPGGHLSYIYLGRGLSGNTVKPNTIVAYEMIPHAGGGTNVLFGDGHVEWVGPVTIGKIGSRANSGQFPVTLPADGTWGK